MPPKRHRPVPTHLDIIPFTFKVPTSLLDWVVCDHCGSPLDLSQPDVEASARLIGVCEACRRWYLILIEPDLASALMVMLPESRALRSAWELHAKTGPVEHASAAEDEAPARSTEDGTTVIHNFNKTDQ